jgi:hypothetical protein
MAEHYTGFFATNASRFVKGRKPARGHGATSSLRGLCTGGGSGFAMHCVMVCKVQIRKIT